MDYFDHCTVEELSLRANHPLYVTRWSIQHPINFVCSVKKEGAWQVSSDDNVETQARTDASSATC